MANDENIRIMETKSGKGLNIAHNGKWFVLSKKNFNEMLNKVKPYVTARPFKVKGSA